MNFFSGKKLKDLQISLNAHNVTKRVILPTKSEKNGELEAKTTVVKSLELFASVNVHFIQWNGICLVGKSILFSVSETEYKYKFMVREDRLF